MKICQSDAEIDADGERNDAPRPLKAARRRGADGPKELQRVEKRHGGIMPDKNPGRRDGQRENKDFLAGEISSIGMTLRPSGSASSGE